MAQGNTYKGRKYFFAIHKPEQWDDCIAFAESCDAYAYIKHDKDGETPHYHFYIEFTNPRSIKSVASDIGIPDNMLEKVRSPEAVKLYLTHSDKKSQQAGKHLYDFSEVVTNLPDSAFVSNKMTPEIYDLITDTTDRYFKGELSYRQMMNVLKPLFYDITPRALLQIELSAGRFHTTTPDDFERVPFSAIDSATLTRNGGLSSVPSSEFRQTELIPKFQG